MVIAHNMMAMNAQRQFNIVGNTKKKSMEKLSSGYRINRAADDAAGLTISEKMRGQIRGLTQGVNNTQDGISLLQVADGALSEVSDMLHRITELSVKSANGTNTESDRQAIQKEINQILYEINRISDATQFNSKQLFGGAEGTTIIPAVYEGTTVGDIMVSGTPATLASKTYQITANDNGVDIGGIHYDWSAFVNDAGGTLNDADVAEGQYSIINNGIKISVDVENHASKQDMIGALNGASYSTKVSSKQRKLSEVISDVKLDTNGRLIVNGTGKPEGAPTITATDQGLILTMNMPGVINGVATDNMTYKCEYDKNLEYSGVNAPGKTKDDIVFRGYTLVYNFTDLAGQRDASFPEIWVDVTEDITIGQISEAISKASFEYHYSYDKNKYIVMSPALDKKEYNGNRHVYSYKSVAFSGNVGQENLDFCSFSTNSGTYVENNYYKNGITFTYSASDSTFISDDGKIKMEMNHYVPNEDFISFSNKENPIEGLTFRYPNQGILQQYFNVSTGECLFEDGSTITFNESENEIQFTEYLTGLDIDDVTFSTDKSAVLDKVNPTGYKGKLVTPEQRIYSTDNLNLWIQSGAAAAHGMYIEIDIMNTDILGINDLNLSNAEGAKHALEAVKIAGEKVSANRSKIGAQQNRLEHTITNENNVIENTTAAESRIRDIDMAKEMVELSKHNILEQAGLSLMTQANQGNQGVLSLLR